MHIVQFHYQKKSPLDITNVDSPIVYNNKKRITTDAYEMMSIHSEPNPQTSLQVQSSIYLQNVHPGLAMFKHDLKTDKMSFEDLQRLCDYNNESELITFLTDLGVLARSQQCLLCGYNMRHMKQENTIYWICTRRVNGKKCNNAKFSIRKGTFFDNSKLPIQSIIRIIWNFVHHLIEAQCKKYAGYSTKLTIP